MMMMVTIRRTSLSSSTTLRRAHFMFLTCLNHSILHNPSQNQKDVTWKVFGGPFRGNDCGLKQRFDLGGISWIHSGRVLCSSENDVKKNGNTADNVGGSGEVKKKRKKLKGKREVVRWLKFFRYKKKRELQRMTAEEKILFKLKKAKRKEERLLGALKKIEPKETAETTHDPEILTPEEHFYFLKMGQKCKNYVPVGRRGVYQGVILNMHLHWKKHQTLKVIVKTFTPEEVKEIAVELARLSGGIVLDIEDEDTIIMYRGKNYAQPPTEIMSPRITLPRKKALDKSKYRDALHAVRRYIPRLEQELELLQAQAETKNAGLENNWSAIAETIDPEFGTSDRWKELMAKSDELKEDGESMTDSEIDSDSDSEALSDIFESESDSEGEVKVEEKPLYLDAFEKLLPLKSDEKDDFEEHLRQISADSTRQKLSGERAQVPDLDEVDKMIIHAASLLKKKRR